MATDRVQDAVAPVVTVYTTGPACVQCTLTESLLADLDIPFVECDITRSENDAAREYVVGDLGYTRAPVVVVDEHDHWSGFQPDELKRIAGRFGSGS
ncbi:glutaredoxin family protein [Microbacterium lacticum]|uniref:glutaredoxin family protein n=1 Tax=Microbacterium lacticum TaxID=33885 RepID=UPI00242D7BB6|nr:glutaredoxin family protein [Microbacterium lacticum]